MIKEDSLKILWSLDFFLYRFTISFLDVLSSLSVFDMFSVNRKLTSVEVEILAFNKIQIITLDLLMVIYRV